MKAFGNYHPGVLMAFFVSVIITAMFCGNPVIQLSALTGGILLNLTLQTRREILSDIAFLIPLFILASLTNPLFSHNGVTVLFYMNSNPVTLEAFIYGAAMGITVIAVILWFKAYSAIMTTDKFLFLFGKTIPKLSLVLSMALRFIPLFVRRVKSVNSARKTLGLYSEKSRLDRIKSLLTALGATLSWSLENAVDTSSSMSARGYGLKDRSSFSIFRFTYKDALLLGVCLILTGISVFSMAGGYLEFCYYPQIDAISLSPGAVISYIAFSALCILPFIIEREESLKWKYYISKI